MRGKFPTVALAFTVMRNAARFLCGHGLALATFVAIAEPIPSFANLHGEI